LHFLVLPIHLRVGNCALDEVLADVAHEPPITSLLYQFKYHSVKEIGTYLADLIVYSHQIPKIDAITCVPLHPRKQWQRGFNQSEVIATRLAQHLHKPFFNLLKRTKYSQAQAGKMNKLERVQNTENLYALNSSYSTNHKWILKQVQDDEFRVQDDELQLPQTILLVDDVITTGTTLNACAKILKQAGVSKVIGLAVSCRI